jgi:hypothetical protein
LSVHESQALAALLEALFVFYEENLQVQAEAQSASTIKSALQMK